MGYFRYKLNEGISRNKSSLNHFSATIMSYMGSRYPDWTVTISLTDLFFLEERMNAQRKNHRVSVADYLTQQIALCGKPQKQIAEECGYEKPNIITMFKQGKTKLPLNKVGTFAKSLGVDPIHMLRVVMQEYSPETWDAINAILGQSLVTSSEMTILEVVREAAGGRDIGPTTKEDKEGLVKLVAEWSKRSDALAKAAVTTATSPRLQEKKA